MFEWDENSVKELQAARNKYARKLKLTNPYYEIENFSMKQLRDMVVTKTDYNTVVRYLNQFDPKAQSKPNPKYGDMPQYAVNEMFFNKKLTDPKNAVRQQEVLNLIEQSTYYRHTLHTNEEKAYAPKIIAEGKTPYEYKRFNKTMRRQRLSSYDYERNSNYKYNYLKTFYRNFHGYRIDYFMDLLDRIPDNIFYEMSIQSDTIFIQNISDPVEEKDMQTHADNIISQWEKRLLDGSNRRKSLSGFNIKKGVTRYDDEMLQQIIADLYG